MTIADPLPLILIAPRFVIGAALAVASVIVAITGPRRPLAVPLPAVAFVVGAAPA